MRAIAAYRAALEERTRDRVPLDWAVTQSNLGNALQTLGERESSTARLKEAKEAYSVALETFNAVGAHYYADNSRRNLAKVQALLGKRKNQSCFSAWPGSPAVPVAVASANFLSHPLGMQRWWAIDIGLGGAVWAAGTSGNTASACIVGRRFHRRGRFRRGSMFPRRWRNADAPAADRHDRSG